MEHSLQLGFRAPQVKEQFQGNVVRELRSGPESPFERLGSFK